MRSTHFLIPAVLSVAGLLAATDFAHAQRGRTGGGRAAVVGGGRAVGGFGGGYGGGLRGGAYYGYGFRGPYYGYGWGYPFYGFGLGVGIGLGGYAPIYGYAFDAYGTPGAAFYPPPGAGAPGAPAMAQEGLPAGSASIRLILPDPNAVVTFDGNKTSQTGGDRMFHTPPLAAGATSSYRIRAIVRQNGKDIVLEQVVPVSPGQNITVDFTRPHSEGIAPPAAK
jgi:uncharacterized protein (TIGR03000 family)